MNLKDINIFIFAITVITFSSCHDNKSSNDLPQLYIQTDVDDLSFGDYSYGLVTYSINIGSTGFVDNKTQIKYRGNSSAHYDKKSFSLKFDTKKSFANLDSNKVWKLNAEYIDKTFIRNKLSYDLFRQFTKGNYAPNIVYVDVFLNGDYHGIYAITERVDENRLHLNKKSDASVLFKEPPISLPPEAHDKKHEKFIEFCNWAEFYKDFSKKAFDKLVSEVYYNQRYPDVNKTNMKQDIFKITDFLFNSHDSVFANQEIFNSFFNLDNIIDLHLLLLLTNNSDGLLKNFYLSRSGAGEPFLFTPWDYDHSYGRDSDGELSLDFFLDMHRMKLIDRLLYLNPFDYRQKLYDKFILLKKKEILTSKGINKMIDEYVKVLSLAIQKNEVRWKLDEIEYFASTNFNKEVNIIKHWTNKRLVIVELHLENLYLNR